MTYKPLITVVTVCYNSAKEIRKTIESVINQSYKNIEYIIVDGGSTDGTNKIIDEYRNKISKYISEPDRGVYDAMNKAIDLATGEWVNFMNSGDCFANNDVINNMFANNKYSENIKIVYGDTIHAYPQGFLYQSCKPMNNDRPMTHQSVFARIESLQKYHFDLSYKIVADENFYHQVENEGGEILYKPIAVSIYESYYGLSSSRLVPMLMERTRMLNIKKDIRWYCQLLKWKIIDFIRMHNFFKYHAERVFEKKLLDPRMKLYTRKDE